MTHSDEHYDARLVTLGLIFAAAVAWGVVILAAIGIGMSAAAFIAL